MSDRCFFDYKHELIDGVDHCYCNTHGTDTLDGHCLPCSNNLASPEQRLHDRLSAIESVFAAVQAGAPLNKAIQAWVAPAKPVPVVISKGQKQ